MDCDLSHRDALDPHSSSHYPLHHGGTSDEVEDSEKGEFLVKLKNGGKKQDNDGRSDEPRFDNKDSCDCEKRISCNCRI